MALVWQPDLFLLCSEQSLNTAFISAPQVGVWEADVLLYLLDNGTVRWGK